MDPAKRPFEIVDKVGIGSCQRAGAANQNIVISRLAANRNDRFGNGPQPAFCPVARDRRSDFACDRKSDPYWSLGRSLGRGIIGLAGARLEDQSRPRCFPATRRGKKITTFLQSVHDINRSRRGRVALPPVISQRPGSFESAWTDNRGLEGLSRMIPDKGSGRQALAPLGPAAGEHAHAPFGRLARPEAVAALADEGAGLIGPFHGVVSGKSAHFMRDEIVREMA